MSPSEFEHYEAALALVSRTDRARSHRQSARGDFQAQANYERIGRHREALSSRSSGVANLRAARVLEGRRA